MFGESAGANAVTTLMTTPAARGLFHRAIAQSAPPNALYLPDLTAKWAGEFVELLSAEVDDASVESTTPEDAVTLLEHADTDAIVRATTALQLRTPDENPGTICLCPVIDGDYLPMRPLDAFKSGDAHPVPLIIGTNDREGSLFIGRLDILATSPGAHPGDLLPDPQEDPQGDQARVPGAAGAPTRRRLRRRLLVLVPEHQGG